ncbi:hypothetical protein TW78_13800 [Vibrio coralliilyticus]|uniref:Uncharacterized protein n=1 Tax=Vibrio coralliilyticus TaxID=190893 RepID=A0A837G1D5_9VIBR|nr:hypothetical protein [Vibrio coralliilyticus]ANW26489.1 hypothetical protein BA953_20245 [Vibrio coralliilyticus]KJY71597.1 hypothetical protein TW78_13800 [Vibrio coralliilyticus]NOH52705.1 hypothetical protein [Vibrio coralliilyticus]NOI59027.1 hypothetical protein [Vibrio coralliilyticus]NUW70524.1 hypothetical protein [Vibrio coralliilyticus]
MNQPDITELLIPQSEWASPELYLYENDDRLCLDLAGAIQYSGINSVGGLVLGFRLVQYAVQLGAGSEVLQRDGISIYTAFPGRGTQDAFEYTCRALRDKRYCCDTTLHHPGAQSGQRGQFLFTMRVNEQSMVMTPADGLPRHSYFEADRRSKESPEAGLQWRNEKIHFANTLLSLPPEQCLRVL